MKRILLGLLPLVLVMPLASAGDTAEIVFDAIQRQIIAEYYREHRTEHPGGKGKRKGLPPGIARNLERGKTLPPGIAKRPLPDALERRLPPPPEGHERVIVDGRVLLIDIATGLIRDKLEDILLDD